MKKDYKVGEIVYWLKKYSTYMNIEFGMVDETWHDGLVIDILTVKETRKIDGVPIDEMFFPTVWKKLPKDWTYNSELYKLTEGSDEFTEPIYIKDFIADKSKILELYEKGILVKAKTKKYFGTNFSEEIDKGTWRIHCNYEGYNPVDVFMPYHLVYHTYEEAKAALDDYNAECDRVKNLSDLDYSIEEMEKNLARWKSIYSIDERKVERVKEFLLDLKDFEEVETTIRDKHIAWKYFKNKRWAVIDEDCM